MVEVNDKVFVAPLYGQPDNTAVITGPAGAGAVLNEGNYNTWTLEWQRQVPGRADGLHIYPTGFHELIDEKNNTIMSYWDDKTSGGTWIARFGIHSLLDGSVIFESPEESSYLCSTPYLYGHPNGICEGMVLAAGTSYDIASISRSVQSYLLAQRTDLSTLEVWRGGTTPLQSWDYRDDVESPLLHDYMKLKQFGISLTSKYILLFVYDDWTVVYPYYYWMLYKGSSV